MTPEQWLKVAERVESLWGKSGKWLRTDASYEFARDVSAQAAASAVEVMFREGRPHVPGPAEVLSFARSLSSDRPVGERPPPERCRHGRYGRLPLAGRLPQDELGDGMELVVCAFCGSELRKPAGSVVGVGDRRDEPKVAR